MDYRDIDLVLAEKGLASEPAFDDLVISIKPIPSFNGCPLGLYYPDSPSPDMGTIVLPPDGLKSALLHELGHRHGHYYYDDLSERYAEDFRKRHQPEGRALLYTGNYFENLSKFGTIFEEGERGAVEIALFQPLTYNELYDIKDSLYSYSEPPPKVYYGGGYNPFVRFEFTKGVDWLVIIGATLTGVLVAGVGALGYAVYKTSKETPWIIPLTLAATGAFFLLRHAYKKGYVEIG